MPLFIYLLAQAINLLVRLISHSSSLLTSTELPTPMIFPYKYFLRSLHYSYSYCHKFPPPLSALSLSYCILPLLYWNIFLFSQCMFSNSHWSQMVFQEHNWTFLKSNQLWSLSSSKAKSHRHLQPPPYIQLLWLSYTGFSFLLQHLYMFLSFWNSPSFLSPLNRSNLYSCFSSQLRYHFLQIRVRP